MLALLGGGDVWGTNPQFPTPPHWGGTILSPSPALASRGSPPSYLGARRRSHSPLLTAWARRRICLPLLLGRGDGSTHSC